MDTTEPTEVIAPAEPSEPVPEAPPRPLVLYADSLAAGRVVIGLAPIVAYEPTMELLGFPAAHDNPSAQMMARLFGVRDIGLGAVVLASTKETSSLCRAFVLNGATDLADAAMISAPLIAHDEIDRAAGRSLGFALGGLSLWTAGWVWAGCWR